jgi:hypothetical protein
VNADAVRAARMRSQRLDGRERDLVELVRRVVGIQAQDATAAALSIRARTEGLTAADVERAIEERRLVRTWLMRGTLHLVAAEDAGWLHALFAPRALRSERRALAQLGVIEAEQARAVEVIRETLGAGALTRAELCAELERAGIDTSGRKAAHLPRLAALEGHVVLGAGRGGKDTYMLAGEPLRARPDTDDAVVELARRYARGYAPADARDFAVWSGLPAHAVEAPDDSPPAPDPPVVRLVPAFDAYLLGYRSRELAVPPEHSRRIWPGGGIVRATVLVNGLAAGTWTRSGSRVAAVELFGDGLGEDALADEVRDVERFLASA